MLERLLIHLAVTVPLTVAVPPVPPLKIATEPLQPAPLLKVPPVPPEKTKVKAKNS